MSDSKHLLPLEQSCFDPRCSSEVWMTQVPVVSLQPHLVAFVMSCRCTMDLPCGVLVSLMATNNGPLLDGSSYDSLSGQAVMRFDLLVFGLTIVHDLVSVKD